MGKRLHASDELRFKLAEKLGEMVGIALALEAFTEPWWRWTLRVSIAMLLEQHRTR